MSYKEFLGKIKGREICVLGSAYRIEAHDYKDDEGLSGASAVGYCSYQERLIVVADADTMENWKKETDAAKISMAKETLRHELMHAFLSESGLRHSAMGSDGSWAVNEEMVDWFAIQSPKIFKVYSDFGIL